MAGDGGGWQGTAGKQGKVAGDGWGRWETVGDGPSLGYVGQVAEKTGRDDSIPFVLGLGSYLSGNFRK